LAGSSIAAAIVQTCEEHGDTPSPCEFTAWTGELLGKKVKVTIVEPEADTKLCGPAFQNEIVVFDQNVMGIPRTPRWDEAFAEGVTTGIRYIDAFAELAASEIESAALQGREAEVRVRIVRGPGDINIKIDPALERYITSHKHKIDVRGPVFTTVRSQLL
jgi:O-phosphoseryl-tRNA synthetase